MWCVRGNNYIFYETPKSKDRVIHDSGLCFLYLSTVNAKNYQMWLYFVCQHIPGVTECEQTQEESCRERVNKLEKVLNVSHLWPYTSCYSGQIAQSLHACFPPLNSNKSLYFLCLSYLFMLQSPRKGSGYYLEFAMHTIWKSPRPQTLHWWVQ